MTNKPVRWICTLGLLVTLMAVVYSPAGASHADAFTTLGASQPYATTQTLISLTSPIHPGAYATIIVRSRARAACTIAVYYKSGLSTAKGLTPKVAGSDGRCAWTWLVGARTTPGTWRIVVKTDVISKTYPFVVK